MKHSAAVGLVTLPAQDSAPVRDDVYYEAVPAGGVAEQLFMAARDRIYTDFLARMKPTATSSIVDVGVSDVLVGGANVLERKYPVQRNITACGLGEGIAFKRDFPEVRYVRIEPNVRLPFADNEFDIAMSNAVAEHLGSFENQVFFVGELARVAKQAYVVVPNRYFLVEHHTALPLLHYWDKGFQLACSVLGKSQWADDSNLILMDRKKLWEIAARTTKSAAVGYTGLRFGPMSSNIFLALH